MSRVRVIRDPLLPRLGNSVTLGTLSQENLDAELTTDGLTHLIESIDRYYAGTDPNNLEILVCFNCQVPKFTTKASEKSLRLAEFIPGFKETECYKQAICAKCTIDSIKASIQNDW